MPGTYTWSARLRILSPRERIYILRTPDELSLSWQKHEMTQVGDDTDVVDRSH